MLKEIKRNKKNEIKFRSSLKMETRGERIFSIINHVLLVLLAICAVYPFVYVLSASISRGSAVDAGKVVLFPVGTTTAAYNSILSDKYFWMSYGNTFFYTILGTAFSMFISITAAYSLSKKRFKFRKPVNLILSISMWFHVGFIPMYINFQSLGALNNRWMILVCFGVHAFNIILLRSYFENVPNELEEAANIDGASDFQILWKVYLPISKPALTTVWLYYAIGRWNGWFWSSILLKEQTKIPLQLYLKQKIVDMVLVSENATSIAGQVYSFTTLTYAIVVCSLIPVIIVYPYIQKYFNKGIMLGSVKE